MTDRFAEINELLTDKSDKLFEACESGAIIDLLAWANIEIIMLKTEVWKLRKENNRYLGRYISKFRLSTEKSREIAWLKVILQKHEKGSGG